MPEPIDTKEDPTLFELFRDLLKSAMGRQKLSPPESVEFYLVNLLHSSLQTQNVYTHPSTEGFTEEPLAFIYGRACEADYRERYQLFKKLGDFSLFIAGFFPESFARQLIGSNYYIQMGATAYSNLSQMTSSTNAFHEIFSNLANRFVNYVDVLSEISEKSNMKKENDSNILRLYEYWLNTGSTRAAGQLHEEGIIPIPNTSLIIQ